MSTIGITLSVIVEHVTGSNIQAGISKSRRPTSPWAQQRNETPLIPRRSKWTAMVCLWRGCQGYWTSKNSVLCVLCCWFVRADENSPVFRQRRADQ